MEKRFSRHWRLCILVFLSTFTFGLNNAQARSSFIPIQGQLTDTNGNPLNGSYNLTCRIYDVYTEGSPLCEDAIVVTVNKGLFSTYLNMQGCSALDGRQLYLGLQVNTDPEMKPRGIIDNVPMAWTLRPGANIRGDIGGDAILDIDNDSPEGRGLRAEALATSGVNYAVIGASRSPNGYGGYFYNNGGGIGLFGQSDTGPAIVAGGTGIIRSAAQTSLWISGNGVRPFNSADSTIINMDTVGGALISRGVTAGNKNVILPIAISGPLYGQNTKVVGLDIYFLSDTGSDGINAVLLRRQTGVCGTASCYASLLHEVGVFHSCNKSLPANTSGCTLHFDLTSNNILTSQSGILYLTLELAFSGAGTFVEIGGARLVLEHN
jgi:hypothetical protein